MDSGFSNMLEKTRKYFQGIPTDGPLSFPHHQPHQHHPDTNGRTVMTSEPMAERFGYHSHLRYSYQPYSSPGHYPRTAVDPKPAAFQHQFQSPSTDMFQKRQQMFLTTAATSAASGSMSPSPYKSPFQLQPIKSPLPPPSSSSSSSSSFKGTPLSQQQQQQQQQQQKQLNHQNSAYKYSLKPQQPSSFSIVPPQPSPSPYTVPKPPQTPFTVSKEQHGGLQPTVPETPPPTPHSHFYNRTPSHSQALLDRDYSRFKPIHTPPKFVPLERPKSELPAGMSSTSSGSQSSHLAIRYDPKLEQPRSGVRALPIAQAKPDANRVVVQKPEPLRYHRAVAADDKRPASVQPSYLESRPFQIKPYDGGSTSNGSSSSSSSSSQPYHRPFAQQSSATSASDHRWNLFGRQDARTPVFQPLPTINGFQQQASSVTPKQQLSSVPSVSQPQQQQLQQQQHKQPQLPQPQVPTQNHPLNLQKSNIPVRLPIQLPPQLKITRDNNNTQMTTLRFETKRESPLDLSVKTVCRSADSTDDRLHPFGQDIPKVNFKPDFNACRSVPLLQPNNSQLGHQQVSPPSSSALPQPPVNSKSSDEAWRVAIDRQIEQKFISYTSSKKQQHSPAQADKRVLEILKQNIEARDQSKPQIAEAPSTPAMVFSAPQRKDPSTTPLKKTDYYMAAERSGTPFPKKIDYYMDRAYCNAPRIRTKAERKQISAEGSSGMRMSSPMAAATAISPHPFLPSNNTTPTKQEQIPIGQTEVALDLKLEIKSESSIKESDMGLSNKEDIEKDDDEDFWMNTCNSFVSQLAETQEKKKVKPTVKRKVSKEPKRKYTKRFKTEPLSDSEQEKIISCNITKSIENVIKNEKNYIDEEVPEADKENDTKSILTENIDEEKFSNEELSKEKLDKKPKIAVLKKNTKQIKVRKPFIKKVIKKKEFKKSIRKENSKKENKECNKEEKKDLKVYKKDLKSDKKIIKKRDRKDFKKDVKFDKKEFNKKEEKKDLKKDDDKEIKGEKKDIKKDDKKDLKNDSRREISRKRIEKENVTKNDNLRRSDGKFNPRQSLRRKNSLKDYTFAFDELLDDAFAHFEEEKIPTRRRRKSSPSPSSTPTVVKKLKDKDNESLRMRLRSRTKPLIKQEPIKKKTIPKRRRKKSLGEKSLNTPDWKDELYKFKRSLRLPSKLISVVSPPTGTVAADQVSLTSIMDITHLPAKEPKIKSRLVGKKGSNNKVKRLGHLFGRRDVFKGRIKREKIVSAEKLLQRNLRKRRQESVKKDEEISKEMVEVTASLIEEVLDEKPAPQILYKRKLMRKKFRSGFDYIKKKKKKGANESVEKKPVLVQAQLKSITPRFASEIQAEVKGWIVNKGHGETILHRASRLGYKDVVGYCIERLEFTPSVADNAGYTPLHEACSQGHYEIAKLLLQFGADVSASAQGGIRPLHEAVENGDVHLVRLLLSYGADPRLATYSGQSPLSLATDKTTKMLLEHHVNDIQGTGNVPVWNFDETSLTIDSQSLDRVLWSSPPQSSLENPTFQFEFAEQILPEVYTIPECGEDTEWVLFSEVSTALAVKTVDALVKLLNDENATTTIALDHFNNKCLTATKSLGYNKPEPIKNSDNSDNIVLVRYNNKIKELLGVDMYTVS